MLSSANSGLRVAALLWSSATPLTAVEPGLAEWFDASFLTERGQARAAASGVVPDSAEAPLEIVRGAWMLDAIAPGTRSPRLSHTLATAGPPALGAVDVPLSLWTHPSFPDGLDFGETRGISFGDYDADGFIDVLALMSGNLWRNVNGETWELVADLDAVLPFAANRYCGHFGDYNNDGLPDIAAAGRLAHQAKGGSDVGNHLLKNLGNAVFVDVAVDHEIIDEQAWGDQETICWGDVDGDADLDLFVPVYPRTVYPDPDEYSSPGNFFYRNLGPIGTNGEYVFSEFSTEARLDNVPGTSRPEGAQFADVDFDGDMDLYCGGLLYQNRSSVGLPDFAPTSSSGSGIGLSTTLEEGAAFADYDLDGDYDLLIAYSSLTPAGARIWENRGDGVFFAVEPGVVESPLIGLVLGLAAEDWDNDGDIDFITNRVFRRNMLVETGERSFIVASHDVNPDHISAATPAWGDWDKDGDLDAAIGNWFFTGHFYENTLYDAVTPDDQRRYVRVRPVRDSTEVPNGLETEYAASVEIDIAGHDRGFRRKKFTASSAGYLNQNEYTLHFGLPDAPDGEGEVRFDVIVDFPSLPSEGMWRVDKHVNAVLGNLDLATLASREIVVFRSGLVRMNQREYPPSSFEQPLLTTAGGGLIMPDSTTPMPAPVPAPDGAFVGVDFDTIGADERVRIREVILDGTLAQPVICGEQTGTILLWDVTSPGGPVLASGGLLDASTSDRNHRSYFQTDWLLDVDRRYRLVARVATYRATDIDGPLVHDDLTVNGGLGFLDALPCTGDGVSATLVDPTRLYVSFRFGPVGDHGSCVGDLDGSGGVSFADLSILLQAWGLSESDANLDGSGAVGFADLTILLQAWGACSREAM